MSLLPGYQFDLYSLFSAFSVIAVAWAGVLIYRRRPAPGTRYLFLLDVAIVIWICASTLEVASRDVPSKILWSQVAYIGIASSPLLFLLFVLDYIEPNLHLNHRTLIALSVIPTLTFLLAVTNSLHWSFWPYVIIDPVTGVATYGHGTLWFIAFSYDYGMFAVGLYVLVRAMVRVASRFRGQIVALLIGGLPPIAVNALYAFELPALRGLDLTPVSFGITGLALSVAVYREGLLDLVPMARDLVIDGLAHGVVVLDESGRVADINRAARTMLNVTGKKVVGLPIAEVAPVWPGFEPLSDTGSVDVTVPGVEPRHLSLQATRFGRLPGQLGRIIVIRDVTARWLAEQERERLLVELQAQRQELQQLSGMLPICPSCKNIRDDEGFWHRVEDYVGHHADVSFTHGICPDCMRALYPDLVGEEDGDLVTHGA